jgi:regulator of chromosome condensation
MVRKTKAIKTHRGADAATAPAGKATVADHSTGPAGCNDVLSFGSGEMSQLGLGDAVLERKNPAYVKALAGHNVIAIASGALHNAVLTDAGAIWTWGCNDDHALGRPGDEWLPAPVSGRGLDRVRVTAICCGDCHTIALDDTGHVWSWGTYKDAKGIIGYNATTTHQSVPARLKGLPPIQQIAAGEHHDLALTVSGAVFEWGDTRVGARLSERLKKTKLTPHQLIFKPHKHHRKIKVRSRLTHHTFHHSHNQDICFRWWRFGREGWRVLRSGRMVACMRGG